MKKLVMLIVMICACSGEVVRGAGEEWPMDGGNWQRTHRSVVTGSTDVYVVWTNSIAADGVDFFRNLTVGYDGTVYAISKNMSVGTGDAATLTQTVAYVYAFASEDGTQKWSQEYTNVYNRASDDAARVYLNGDITVDSSKRLFFHHVLYDNAAHDYNGFLHGLQDSGTSVAPLAGFPVTLGNYLYASCSPLIDTNGKVYTGTGKGMKCVRVDTDGAVTSTAGMNTGSRYGVAMSDDGQRIFAVGSVRATADDNSHSLYAWDVSDLSTAVFAVDLIPNDNGNRAPADGPLAYISRDNGTILVPRKTGVVAVTNVNSSSPVLIYESETNGVDFSSAIVAGDRMRPAGIALSDDNSIAYIGGDRYGRLWAMNTIDGSLRWVVNPSGLTGSLEAPTSRAIVDANGWVYFTQLDKLYIYRDDVTHATQLRVWDDPNSDVALTGPVLVNCGGQPCIYVAGGNIIYALSSPATDTARSMDGGNRQRAGMSSITGPTSLITTWNSSIATDGVEFRRNLTVGYDGTIYGVSHNKSVVGGVNPLEQTVAYAYAFSPADGAQNWTWECTNVYSRLSDDAERVFLGGDISVDAEKRLFLQSTTYESAAPYSSVDLYGLQDQGVSQADLPNFPVYLGSYRYTEASPLIDVNGAVYTTLGGCIRVDSDGTKHNFSSMSRISSYGVSLSDDEQRIFSVGSIGAYNDHRLYAWDVTNLTSAVWSIDVIPDDDGNREPSKGHLAYISDNNGTVFIPRKTGIVAVTGVDGNTPVIAYESEKVGVTFNGGLLGNLDYPPSLAFSADRSVAYIGADRYNKFWAMNTADGSLAWQVNPSGNSTSYAAMTTHAVVDAEDRVYFAQLDKLYVYDGDGALIDVWDDPASSDNLIAPVLVNYNGQARIYVAGGSTIYAISEALKGTMMIIL